MRTESDGLMTEKKQEKKPPGFMIYEDDWEMMQDLKTSEIGELVESISRFFFDGEEVDTKKMDRATRIIYRSIKGKIIRDADKYIEKCKKNSENAKARWDNATASDGIQADAMDANYNQNYKDNQNQKEKEKENNKESNKGSLREKEGESISDMTREEYESIVNEARRRCGG